MVSTHYHSLTSSPWPVRPAVTHPRHDLKWKEDRGNRGGPGHGRVSLVFSTIVVL